MTAHPPLHPLVGRLLTDHRLAMLDTAADLAGTEGPLLVFLPGYAKAHVETADVAVILPELLAAFGGRLGAAVAGPALETELRAELGGIALPALVMVRHGRPAGAVSRVRDWRDYLDRIAALLDAPPALVS
jgi:hydrogenase-1 operon protein HyaE